MLDSDAPMIGITTYGRNEDNDFTIPAVYVDSVRRSGGVPILLPPGEPRVTSWLERVDGVILVGGGDIGPDRYGGGHHEAVYMVDPERDDTEFTLTRCILDQEVPTLGICRGAQVLNVVLGGTLFEDLPEAIGEDIEHRLPPREPTPHAIEVVAGSRLAEVVEKLRFSAASWHHQGIRDVGEGLEVVAHAPDGVVEALELRSHPWLIAVQWHPELTAATDPVQQRLFDALVRESRRLRGGK